MDAEYIRKNDIHEKYLLNQLSASEREDYEKSIRDNPVLQKELADERGLIEQMRAAGSDSLRRDIQQQVREIKSRKPDWSILYKAAAVLLLFVLLPSVVYYQLYQPDAIDGYPVEQVITKQPAAKDAGEIPQDEEIQYEPAPATKDSETIAKKNNAEKELTAKSAGAEQRIEKYVMDDILPEDHAGKRATGMGTSVTEPDKTITPEEHQEVRLSNQPLIEEKATKYQLPAGSLRAESDLFMEKPATAARGKMQSYSQNSESDVIEIALHQPKVFIYNLNEKQLTLRLFHDDLLVTTDSLQTEISGDPQNPDIKLIVPDSLWRYKKEEIIPEAGENNFINIRFAKGNVWQVYLDPAVVWSHKID
jgi:hypothetical protein